MKKILKKNTTLGIYPKYSRKIVETELKYRYGEKPTKKTHCRDTSKK